MLAAAGALVSPAHAAERPEAAMLLDRLCAQSLRANEEDRLYGLISLTVRATIKSQAGKSQAGKSQAGKHRAGLFSPELVADAVQDSLGGLIEACPQLAKTDEALRLGVAIDVMRDATIKRLEDAKTGHAAKQTRTATAADLSQELSSPEIDTWLDTLPPRKRALALFLYASDVTRKEAADALGLRPAAIPQGLSRIKSDLLKFYRQDWGGPAEASAPEQPALEPDEAGQRLAALLGPGDADDPTARITGISRDIYAGWSLLATVTGLPADQRLVLPAPLLLEPEDPGHRRMIAVALDEISNRRDKTRRFLIKAYAIDADKDGGGLRDTFRLGSAAVDNTQAQETLRKRGLAAIEISQCLSHDFGTAPDPGLCR